MIRFSIIGFKKSDKGYPRWGDCTIIDDGENYLVIDGYCGIGTTRLIDRLKKLGVKSPILFISHAHYDHYYGIRKIINDTWFTPKCLYMYDPDSLDKNASSDVRSEVATMKAIRDEAKKRGIPVEYLGNHDRVEYGEIKFNVYRVQPYYKGNSDAYINDGSLVFYFPELRYLTSGDGSEYIGQLCKDNGLKPMMLKIPHHGNNCNREQSTILWNLGCRYCWDNDISTHITDFLETGREDCIGVGMEYFNCIGDLNFIAYDGNFVIYKGVKHVSYKCSYKGKNTLKKADLKAVMNVLRGKYGNNDDRITALLDAGYAPASVQGYINEIIKLIKG